MPDGADDRDALIKDLIDESFGLRTKAEQLSQYVESKVAELVKTQMELEALEDGSKLHELNAELASLRHGLEEATKLRNDVQSRLDQLSKEHEDLYDRPTRSTAWTFGDHRIVSRLSTGSANRSLPCPAR
jgi:DNA repair exonuclease SbcCD ATPase subunit